MRQDFACHAERSEASRFSIWCNEILRSLRSLRMTRQGEKDKDDVLRVFDRRAESNDGQSADEPKSAGQVIAYHHDDQGGDHGQGSQRADKGCGISWSSICPAVKQRDEKATEQRYGQVTDSQPHARGEYVLTFLQRVHGTTLVIEGITVKVTRRQSVGSTLSF